MRTVIALLLSLAALCAGCGGRPAEGPSSASPEALLARFADAIERLDGAALAGCLDPASPGTKPVAALLTAAAKMLERQRDFDAAVRARFGAGSIERFTGGPEGMPVELVRRLETLRRDARVEVEGTTARVMPGGEDPELRAAEPARMVQRDGVWFFEVAPYLPDDPNLCESVEFLLGKLADRYEKARELAGSAADEKAFATALAELDADLERRTRRVFETVEPFLRRHR
ncbi:MAG: hypothetical protein JXQ29_18180 [Planctomycetes bacterium]|nr:hypothetical protein [Planctomycetota bacterium]